MHSYLTKAKKQIDEVFFANLDWYSKPGKKFESDSNLHNLINHLIVEHLKCDGFLEVADMMLNVNFFSIFSNNFIYF